MTGIITGGHGYIGFNLLMYYVDRGYEMIVVDPNCLDSIYSQRYIHYQGKIEEFVLNEFKDIDFLVHLAGSASVPLSVKDPMLDFDRNASATVQILDWCKRNKVKKVVLNSSVSVLGENARESVSEDVLSRPISPYGLSKSVSEQYGLLYSELFKVDVSIARIFNVYGPGLNRLFVSDMIEKIKQGGTISFLGDGTQVRDYLFITDMVEALDLVVQRGITGNVYNVCSGEPLSLLDLCRKIHAIVGKEELKFEFIKTHKADISKWYGCIEKISNIGFKPKITLEEGLLKTINTCT
mgnify:CR=1 FL=1